MTPIGNTIDGLGVAAASAQRDAEHLLHRADASQLPSAAPATATTGYEPPRVEPLGHWQVHTMDTYSIDILP